MNKKLTYGIFGTVALAAGLYLLFSKKSKTTMPNSSTNTPRGYRNNNPLNIRYYKSNNWQGRVLPNTDGTFEQFVSMAYGYRAALFLIRKKIREGKDTVAELISVWAPAEDNNNTSGYINRVCATTGYTPSTILSENDREQLVRLAYAMAIVENGNTPLPSYDDIYAGWNLL